MVGTTAAPGAKNDWFWVEEQDASSWLQEHAPSFLKEKLEEFLRFESAKMDGEATCFTRKGKLKTGFYYDVKLVNCHWNKELYGDTEVTFDVSLLSFSSEKDNDDLTVKFHEYNKSISKETQQNFRECIKKACVELAETMSKLFVESLNKKKPLDNIDNNTNIKNGSGKTLSFSETLPVAPEMIFKFFSDSEACSTLTEQPSEIKMEINSNFNYLGGFITGKVLKFDQPKFIEFRLRFSDWTSDQISKLRIECVSNDSSSTDFKLIHTNIPEEHYTSVESLWNQMFISRMKKIYGLMF